MEIYFFLTKRIGAAAGDEEARIKERERFSSMYVLRAFSSTSESPYIGPKLG